MSKFDGLFNARGNNKSQNKEKGKRASRKVKAQQSAEDQTDESRRRGRPRAKRSDPEFVGFTTYIRKETHRKAKMALLEEAEGRELSELVEDLLSKWLKVQSKH